MKGSSNSNPSFSPRQVAIVAALCAIVLAFRVGAWLRPSEFVVIPPSFALPLNALGVLYMACGVWAWLSRPSHLTRIFLITALGGGIHWGGSIAAGNAQLEIAFLAFYIAVTAIGDGAFLDFALRYADTSPRRGFRAWGLYVLGLVTFIAIPITPFLPSTTIEALLGAIIMLAFAMSIIGGVVFIVKWFRASGETRRELFLSPIVAALVLSTAVDLVAEQGILPGPAEAWTLGYALVPVTMALALTRLRPAS